MEVLYHGIKTRYAYDFPLCFPHELIMSLRGIGNQMTASAIKVAPYIHFNGGLVTKHGVSTRAQMAILSFRNSMTAST